jgi:hypothetical protein
MVNNMRLKKGSKEAKAFMAKLRAAKGSSKVGASYGKNPFTFDVKAIRSNGQIVKQTRSIYADNIKQAKSNLKNFLDEYLGYKNIIITAGRKGHEGVTKINKIGYKSDRLTTLPLATRFISKYKKAGYSRKDAIKNANLDAAFSVNGWNKGGTYIIESGEKKPTKAKKVISVTRRKVVKAGTFKKFSKVGALDHKDTKSHNVNIRVLSGVNKNMKPNLKFSVGSLPSYKDKDAAREIQLFADNDYQLYSQRLRPILINLSKKHKKGIYDVAKAAKLFRYFIDAAMQKYNKDFGSKSDSWSKLLSVSDRNVLANDYAINTLEEFELGNYTEK